MQILSVSSIVVVTVVRLVISMVVEKNIHIKGKKKLTGELSISGAKNAVLKQYTDIGAINSKEQLNKITNLVDEGVADGGIFKTYEF